MSVNLKITAKISPNSRGGQAVFQPVEARHKYWAVALGKMVPVEPLGSHLVSHLGLHSRASGDYFQLSSRHTCTKLRNFLPSHQQKTTPSCHQLDYNNDWALTLSIQLLEIQISKQVGWKMIMVYIYGVQCHIFIYVYIIERVNQANEHIHHLTNLIFLVVRMLKIYSFSNFEISHSY